MLTSIMQEHQSLMCTYIVVHYIVVIGKINVNVNSHSLNII